MKNVNLSQSSISDCEFKETCIDGIDFGVELIRKGHYEGFIEYLLILLLLLLY